MSGINDWLSRPSQPEKMSLERGDATQSARPQAVTRGPQPGVPAPNAGENLPLVAIETSTQLFVIGAHGGAGESTLASLLNAEATQHAWPQRPSVPPNVLVVARTSVSGLRAAQSAARQWASGSVPLMNVKGVVFMADAPGRTPKPLRELMAVVAGGYPKSWFVPWIEQWRTAESDHTNIKLPKELVALIDEYPSLITWNGK